MPVYNCQEFIGEAIESVLNQDYNYFELIIIDDGSTDNTPWVVEKYRDDSRLNYYRQTHKGLAVTRNRLIELSRGEYICPQDADDIMLPGRLKLQAEFLDNHPHMGVVYGKAKLIDYRRKFISESGVREFGSDINKGWDLIDFGAPHCTSLIRKIKILEVGCYDLRLRHAVDRDIMLKLAEVTQFYFINKYVYLYRRHPRNMSLDSKTIQREHIYLRKNAIRRRYDKEGQLKLAW